MMSYAECLAATNLGKKNTTTTTENQTETEAEAEKEVEDGNVDILVIPVLCNLAAASMQLKQWRKGMQLW
jgi:hypothetical protein